MRVIERFVGPAAVATALALLVGCSHLLQPKGAADGDPGPECAPGAPCPGHDPRVCKSPTIMALAGDLDHLERHIDWYGSAVAKVPDVWGQARLTKHREEFETQMAANLGKFHTALAGSQFRTDQAYFEYALALSSAATAAVPSLPPTVSLNKTNVNFPSKSDYIDSTGVVPLEPTTMLAQMRRYLDFLNQLRRENEGSDTADGPGYSLNLVRIPVSVLPGKRTDVGYGAEVTMTMSPVLGDDLLPMTFRNMIVNDLVGQIGLPLAQFIDDDRLAKPDEKYLRTEVQTDLQWLETGVPFEGPSSTAPPSRTPPTGLALPAAAPPSRGLALMSATNRPGVGRSPPPAPLAPTATAAEVQRVVGQRVTPNLVRPRLSFSNGLDTKQAFPSAQLLDVYGLRYAFEIAFGAQQSLAVEIARDKFVSLPDVQAYLREQLQAAYLFLAAPANQTLWHFCDADLVTLVRSQQWDELKRRRTQYEEVVRTLTGSESVTLTPNDKKELTPTPVGKTRQFSVTSALAWALLVDAALLTDRLMRDMKETASSKGVRLAGCRQWLPYYLPEPPPEARAAFNEYVRVRWPIRVFALDPYTEQQNIAESLSSRRELQLALSVAFTQGKVGANQLIQYARRLEAEYQTIALNNTQVGFGHGEDVFGWRFYPRFQTPDTDSNLTVLVRDTLIGGPNKNALLRERRLESGPRECVAVVMMPSFVPYVTVDATTNWFGLANPKHKVLDHTQAMRLSRTVQTIKTCGPGVTDAGCYRDGDFARLLRRAEQLEARLPTQTLITPVPILNTLGGFAMFSNGTTDLAPELDGWYGAPGITLGAETTLFLVGDHFSPLRSRVIVGNQRVAVPDDYPAPTTPPAGGSATPPVPVVQRMLSRQVMQVTIAATPTPVTVTDRDGRACVTVHLATPYGVSRALLVPVAAVAAPASPQPPPPPKGYTLATPTLALPYSQSPVGPKFNLAVVALDAKTQIQVGGTDPSGATPQKVQLRLDFPTSPCPLSVTTDAVAAVGGTFTFDSTQVTKVLTEVFAALNARGPFTGDTNPLAGGLTATATVLDAATPPAAKPVALSTPIKLTFTCQGCKDSKDTTPPTKPMAGEIELPKPMTPEPPAHPTPTPQPAPPVAPPATTAARTAAPATLPISRE